MFTTQSSTVSSNTSRNISRESLQPRHKIFQSRRIHGERQEKPWVAQKRTISGHISRWCIPVSFILGFLIWIGFAYWGASGVKHYNFKLRWTENFETLDPNVWTHEIQCGGFGAGSWELTTNDTEQSYIKDGQLYITPTLVQDGSIDLTTDGASMNLTELGLCTTPYVNTTYSANYPNPCYMQNNFTQREVMTPVKSARINTKNYPQAHMKFGKMEIRAKLPRGSYLWPALWMMPVEDVYGIWPYSGEIDIAEVKGDSPGFALKNGQAGSNRQQATLHFGSKAQTTWLSDLGKKDLATGFNVYGLIWTKETIEMYLNDRSNPVYTFSLTTPLPSRYPVEDADGNYFNPFAVNGTTAAPFDQAFYLILNVAIGGSYFYYDTHDYPTNSFTTRQEQLYAAAQSLDWIERLWPESEYDRSLVVDWIRIYDLLDSDGQVVT